MDGGGKRERVERWRKSKQTSMSWPRDQTRRELRAGLPVLASHFHLNMLGRVTRTRMLHRSSYKPFVPTVPFPDPQLKPREQYAPVVSCLLPPQRYTELSFQILRMEINYACAYLIHRI